MSRTSATAIGFVAVLLWALLALFTVGSAPTPPLLLNTLSFGIGGGVGLVWAWATGSAAQMQAVPLRVYAFGAIGLLAYHLLYFSALRLAPAAEAGLIAYLWPLLIVVFSGLLPSERLRAGHIIGALLGFAGAAIIISGGGAGLSGEYLSGYLLALLAAFTWTGYSVLSRMVGSAPTASVAIFCLVTSALSLPLHLIFEETVLPSTVVGWASIAGLGLGPVGFAFYVWDIGCKRGDIQLLGTSSYAAPLLSTLVLVLAGIAEPSTTLLWAAMLITGGALIAARASFASE
ncbi:EamA family transporter [Sulfitobacter sp. F26169L]|uniref:aromatic amino acid exporter YddG n=1 Tax=Sulfitobacter sp. F26169L TaxID=2996015 RepID=UPI002260CC9C|nr:EamA family transporter [Sulfitobacter sp. F26169L]MCX7566943.1 EamA family transporter [Sulfitobacter sp. F26169L]